MPFFVFLGCLPLQALGARYQLNCEHSFQEQFFSRVNLDSPFYIVLNTNEKKKHNSDHP